MSPFWSSGGLFLSLRPPAQLAAVFLFGGHFRTGFVVDFAVPNEGEAGNLASLCASVFAGKAAHSAYPTRHNSNGDMPISKSQLLYCGFHFCPTAMDPDEICGRVQFVFQAIQSSNGLSAAAASLAT